MKHTDQTKTMKNTSKKAQNTIPKTSENETKCPFLKGVSTQILAEPASFQKLGLNSGFQHQDSQGFSTVLQSKRQLTRKNIPEYRLIRSYYKSTTQYWKERNRRKQEWKLYSEGFNYQQIAEKLGVSAKTVSHDLRKVFSYYKGQINRKYRLVREARDAEYMAHLDSLTLAEQREQLHQNFKALTKLMAVKERTRSTLNVIIDIDEFTHYFVQKQRFGRPLISVSPHTLHCKFSDMKLHFQFRIGGELVPYGTLALGGS